MKRLWLFLIPVLLFTACSEEEPLPFNPTHLRIKFKFDPTQDRLDNIGEPSTIPAGNAAQTPDFRGMSVHFIEFVESEWAEYKTGTEIYQGAEVSTNKANPFGFTTAIDFDNAIVSDEGIVFLEIPLSSIAPGTYKFARVSVSYQNYDITYNLLNIPGGIPDQLGETGSISSVLGYFTHLNDISPNALTTTVNDDVLQGFWAFETNFSGSLAAFNEVYSGQAPQGATTVVNPLPTAIPPGSCVVSGGFVQDLVITGEEEEDIDLTLSFSINNSLEWVDNNANGELDLDLTSGDIEEIVDMGLRGLKVLLE